MKIEVLLCLLAALVCSTAGYRLPDGDQLADIRTERSASALNELARRRKRYSEFVEDRRCCVRVPKKCCPCCNPQSPKTTAASGIPVPLPGETIVYLGSKNFTVLVLNSEFNWIVIFNFSRTGCNFCERIEPILKQTADRLSEYPNIRIGIFYAEFSVDKAFFTSIGIREYSSVYFYCRDKQNPYDYGPPKTAEELISSVLILINRPKIAVGNCAEDSEPFQTSNVYELNDINFEQVVLSCTEEVWVVNFYLAWPEVCKNFFKVFEAAAKQLKIRVKFGSFYQRCRIKKSPVLERYGVASKACWVKMFPKGKKGSCILDFNNGKHTAELDRTLLSWIESYLNGKAGQGVCGGTQPAPIESTTTPIITRRQAPTTTTTTTRKPTTTTTTTTPRPTTTTTTTTTTIRKPTTTTTTPRLTTTTTTTRKPTTTTTTRKPTTTTTTTTTRRPTTTTTRRPTTPKRTTPTPPWQGTTTRRPSPSTTKSKTPPPRPKPTTPGIDVIYPATGDPDTGPQPLPEPGVNEDWCKYRCCIVYFLPQRTKCEVKCYKTYITTLERVCTKEHTGCALYFEYQGKRPDFEAAFAIVQFPRILIVTTETRMYATSDGTVSESELDRYIKVYVQGQLPMKRIPKFASSACGSEASYKIPACASLMRRKP